MRRSKKYLFIPASITILCYFSTVGRAQDYIKRLDGDSIKCKVNKIGTAEIEYKEWDNLEGPDYAMKKSEVQSITYRNGKVDIFARSSAEQKRISAKQSTKRLPIDTTVIATESDFKKALNSLYPEPQEK